MTPLDMGALVVIAARGRTTGRQGTAQAQAEHGGCPANAQGG